MPDEKKKPAAKKKSNPSEEKVSKADLSRAKSELRAEFADKFEKIEQAINLDLRSV